MFDDILNEFKTADEFINFLNTCIPLMEEEGTEKNAKVNKIIKEKNKLKVHEIVSDGIEKHIDKNCIETCKYLWSNNIFTENITVNKNKIEIFLGKLNENNKKAFNKLHEKDNLKYKINSQKKYIIKIDTKEKDDKEIKKELINSVKKLSIQDTEIGFLDEEHFLMDICGCEKVEGIRENAKRLKPKIVFDADKMEKSLEEYIEDNNFSDLYVKSEKRIYLDKYYLDAHNRFLESLKK